MKSTMLLPRSLLALCYVASCAYAAPVLTTSNNTAIFRVGNTGGNVSSTHQYGLMFGVYLSLKRVEDKGMLIFKRTSITQVMEDYMRNS